MKQCIMITSVLSSMLGCDGVDPHIQARKRITAHVERGAQERGGRALLDQHRPTHQTRDCRLASPHALSAECQSRGLCDQRRGEQEDHERSQPPTLEDPNGPPHSSH